MAKNKIQRIDQEIAKVREKIAEYQDKLKTLEAQKTEAENLEICLLYTSPPPMPLWGSSTRKSGRPNRTMWAWRAPTSPRRLPRPALGLHGKATAATS